MDFETAVKTCVMQKYFTLKGRASRSEFWWFYLFQVIFILVAYMQDFTSFPFDERNFSPVISLISGLVAMALFLPGWGAMVRRLHDAGYSGWWLLLMFTGIGTFVLVAWWASKGDSGPNLYGDPVVSLPPSPVPTAEDGSPKWY